jgi:hypothetical protein
LVVPQSLVAAFGEAAGMHAYVRFVDPDVAGAAARSGGVFSGEGAGR